MPISPVGSVIDHGKSKAVPGSFLQATVISEEAWGGCVAQSSTPELPLAMDPRAGSKLDPCGQLDHPWRSIAAQIFTKQAGGGTHCARDQAEELTVGDIAPRVRKVRMVEHVEELCSYFERGKFQKRQFNRFEHGKVGIDKPWSEQLIAPLGAEFRGRSKLARVQAWCICGACRAFDWAVLELIGQDRAPVILR